MTQRESRWERPESLRERARWYRVFAEGGAGGDDRSLALRLAAELEARADELERTPQERDGPSTPEQSAKG